MNDDNRSAQRPLHPRSHFNGLAWRAAAILSPNITNAWLQAWAGWTIGRDPPDVPWLGAAPEDLGKLPLDPERMDPCWTRFYTCLTLGRSAHSEIQLDWLSAFWTSLCLLPDPHRHLASHALARTRIAEITQVLYHFSRRPYLQAHDPLLNFSRALAFGLGVSRHPERTLLLLGQQGVFALARIQHINGLARPCPASLADRMLAALLIPFLHGSRDHAWTPILMTRMFTAGIALRGMGASPSGVAACLGDQACLAWLSWVTPMSPAPDNNRLWRTACTAAFGPDLLNFSQALSAAGACCAAEALGSTLEETERLELLRSACLTSAPQGVATILQRL